MKLKKIIQIRKMKLVFFILLGSVLSLLFVYKFQDPSSKDLQFMSGVIQDGGLKLFLFIIFLVIYFSAIGLLLKAIQKKYLIYFFSDIYRSRSMIFQLAKNDFKSRFSGSFFGIFWAILSPLLTIGVYWFVFEIGFKTSNIKDIPFILWFMMGIVPWFYFSEALSGVTNVFVEYSYLVKKVVFNINVLPFVKLLSISLINTFFIVILISTYLLYGGSFSLYNLQIFYYLICLVFLCMGLTLLTSTISVFFKDLNQIIGITLQFGFWFTPIVWNTDDAPKFLANFFQLNPMVYIIDGFRDSFLYHHWFIEKPLYAAYFWLVSILLLTLGIFVNKRLKSHFSDVL
ncbi:ABC transporter permease [Paenibacillus sp. FA6]|uniref:ABC transporter permease n=1 Tax=Paenibacillus sp. FA6 TaxID=3413029 RepID=UPI003F65F7D1